MTFEWAEWGPPLAALVLGLVGGGVAVAQRRGARDPAVAAAAAREDLTASHRDVVEALKVLDAEREKLAAEDYRREREALVARGATALRLLDELAPAEPEDAAVARLRALEAELGAVELRRAVERVYGARGDGAWRGAAYTLLVVGLAGLFFGLAGVDSSSRAPGGSMTGGSATDPTVAWKDRLDQDPNDVEALGQLARHFVLAGDAPQAMEFSRRALDLRPEDPTALTVKATLALMVGMPDRALEGLAAVQAAHPQHPDAFLFRGMILLQTGDIAGATRDLEVATRLAPNDPLAARALAQARSLPAAPAAPAPAAGGDAPVVLGGTLRLAAAVAETLSGQETLYVSLRDPAGGPPLAALRLKPGPFPQDFVVRESDALAMGGAPRPFPERMLLAVRIDRDGNPTTKDDIVAQVEVADAARGQAALDLELTPVSP